MATENEPSMTLANSDLSESAKESIRFTFNPSGDATVHRLKFLAAALITEYEKVRDSGNGAGREAAVAITNLQTASMWGVLAATKGFGPNQPAAPR